MLLAYIWWRVCRLPHRSHVSAHFVAMKTSIFVTTCRENTVIYFIAVMGYKWAQDSLFSVAFVGAINFSFWCRTRPPRSLSSLSSLYTLSSSTLVSVSIPVVVVGRFVFHMHIYFSLWFHFLKIAPRQIRRHTAVVVKHGRRTQPKERTIKTE